MELHKEAELEKTWDYKLLKKTWQIHQKMDTYAGACCCISVYFDVQQYYQT